MSALPSPRRGWAWRRSLVVLALLAAGCGVTVHADRGTIGGGPEQATAQARAHFQATVVAVATSRAGTGEGAGTTCDCDSTGK